MRLPADPVRVALVGEGSSDRLLLAPATWLLRSIDAERTYELEPVDLRDARHAPKTIEDRIGYCLHLEAWDVILYHRDADGPSALTRTREIEDGVQRARDRWPEHRTVPIIPVVPIQETEAWLLIDERAIRRAALDLRPLGESDPGYLENSARTLPGMSDPARVEKLGRAKETLHGSLRVASGRRGRKLGKFNVEQAYHRIQDHVDDWSFLDALSAFQELRSRLEKVLV